MPALEGEPNGVTLKELQEGAEIPLDTTALNPDKPIGDHMTPEIEERVAPGKGI